MRLSLRKFGDLRRSPLIEKGRPLHVALGIKTHVHRQAILNDPRFRVFDWQSRSWNHQHLFRESITLAGAA